MFESEISIKTFVPMSIFRAMYSRDVNNPYFIFQIRENDRPENTMQSLIVSKEDAIKLLQYLQGILGGNIPMF